jgi:hypothetical protein
MNLKMDLILLSGYSCVALLSINHKCTHPCLHCSVENPGVEYFIDYAEF